MNPQLEAEAIRKKLLEHLSILTKKEAAKASSFLQALSFFMRDGSLYISFPHRFFETFYGKSGHNIISRLIRAEFGDSLNIAYANQTVQSPQQEQHNCIPPQTDPFADFITSEKNQFAVSMAKAACSSPDTYLFLIVTGPPGSGKTHLISAMQSALAGNRRVKRCERSKALSFTWPENPDLYWQNSRALLLDDIHDLAGRMEMQNNLSYCLDSAKAAQCWHRLALVHEKGIFTAFGDRLARRMEEGVRIELCLADLAMRLEYAEYKCAQLSIPKSLAFTLARHAKNIPAISGLLQKLSLYGKLTGQLPTAEQIEKMTIPDGRLPDWKIILNNVSVRLGVTTAEILGTSRLRQLVLARQIAMYVCRRKLGLSFPEIGRLFGGKDHSTVLHSINKIVKLRKVDSDVHNLLTELESREQ